MPQIVLASTSPRRKMLLEQIGLSFEIVAPNYEEVLDQHKVPADLAIELSLGKAMSVASDRPHDIVIGSDTFIVFDGAVIGKPVSPANAVATLQILRGNKNVVLTGWAVVCGEQQLTGVVGTNVWMNDISDADIEAYVATGEPLDKAGSYAVTGKGAIFIDRIEGSIDATIGLPLTPLAAALRHFGVNLFAEPKSC